MSNIIETKVLDVHHWNDSLFSIKVTRDPGLRFENGQFAMIGIMVDGKPLMRAYSLASANWEDFIELFSIKVQNGPLTSRLQHIQVGDTLLINKKVTGTLLHRNLVPGKRLWFWATGTGLAPFLSLIKDPETYEKYDQVILCHGVREISDLAYQEFITQELPENEFIGADVAKKLVYYPTVTREDFKNMGRITDLVDSGKLFTDLGVPPLNKEVDRVMICGSEAMMRDLAKKLDALGFEEGSNSGAGHYVIEKAFAEK